MKNSGLGPLLKSIVSGRLGDGLGNRSSQVNPSRNGSGQVRSVSVSGQIKSRNNLSRLI